MASRHASDGTSLTGLYGEGQSRLLQKFCTIREGNSIQEKATNASV